MMQIGIIGSMTDIGTNKKIQNLARQIGREVAQQKAVLLYSYEGDFESFSTIAAKEAEKWGGNTVTFLWGNQKQIKELPSIRVVTGQLRGGGREFSFISSCDGIIAIGGGSGTLMEFAMAYQANIPIIALENSGGWSDKLKNSFLDERKRIKILSARTPKEAVSLIMQAASRGNV